MFTKNRTTAILTALLCGLTFAPGLSPAQAQNWPDFLETNQLFRVQVTGTSSQNTSISMVKGTAWAVAPGVLITAGHVTGDARTFLNASNSDKIFIPKRFVSVEFAGSRIRDGSDPRRFNKGTVTPSPFEGLDAARIGFRKLQANPFPLSACEIDQSKSYRVLKLYNEKVQNPELVPLEFHNYGESLLGDAGSVVVMKVEGGRIVESDSGSPVLDPQNRVIGLVSAISDDTRAKDEVHITLVRSFLDLIPLQAGGKDLLDISCSERVYFGKVADLEQQIMELKKTNIALIQQTNALLSNQLTLAKQAERTNGENRPELPKDDGTDPETRNKKFWEKYKEAAQSSDESGRTTPLRHTVTRIREDLGELKWSFSGTISDNDVLVKLKYERSLSGEPYAPHLLFCIDPIVWNVDPKTASQDDPVNKKFYEAREGPFSAKELRGRRCVLRDHSAPRGAGTDGNLVKLGIYQWAYPFVAIEELNFTARKLSEGGQWDGTTYLQIFEPRLASSGETTYYLHTRAFIDLINNENKKGNNGILPCRFYNERKNFNGIFAAMDATLTKDVKRGEPCI